MKIERQRRRVEGCTSRECYSGHNLEDIRKAKEAVGKLDRATEDAMIEGLREKCVLPQGCGCGCGEVYQGAESEETV
jgi:hypothetical protein